MKQLLTVALALSLALNLCLVVALQVRSNTIDAGVHAEMISEWGLRDLSYLLRKCGATRTELLDWARGQPKQSGSERLDPELVENRLVWFPLEVSFDPSGHIERVSVGGSAY